MFGEQDNEVEPPSFQGGDIFDHQDVACDVDPYALSAVNLPHDDPENIAQDVEPASQENYDLNALTQPDGPVVREYDYFGS